MSIQWGSAIGNNSSTGDMRLGVAFEQLPTTVNSDTASVVMRAHLYIWTKWSVSDTSNTFSLWGSWPSQSFAVSVSTGNNSTWNEANIQYLGFRDVTVTLTLGVTTRLDIGMSLTGINAAPGTAQLILAPAVYASARPYALPGAPSSASVSRVSDAQHTVSWVRPASASVAQYTWTGVKIERWDNMSNTWVQVATVTGTGTSWADTGTSANRRYQYRVRSYNSAGHSGYATSGYVATTPSAPTNASAVRSGLDIAITWQNQASYSTGAQVLDSVGGADPVLVETLAPTATSFTHVGPSPSATHRYSIRAVTDGPLYSAFAVTESVLLLTPPAAPTGLSPVGGAYDATEGIVCAWTHNALDASPQSAYELMYRQAGGSWTSTGKFISGVSSRVLVGLDNGVAYEWKVKTWGEHADASPESAVASFATSARPTLVLTAPAFDGVEHPTPSLTVTHTYADPEGKPQSAHRTILRQGSFVLWQKTTSGAGLSEVVPLSLQDGQEYEVDKQVQDGDGLWSLVVTRPFVVDYIEPMVPVIEVEYDPATGSALVIIANPTGESGEPDVVYNEVWRLVDGKDLELVATDVPPGGAVIDRLPGLNNENTYHVKSFSALPSMSLGMATLTTDGLDGWVWVNSGAGYQQSLRFRLSPKFTDALGRQSQSHRFAGRKYPVMFTGEAVEDSTSVSGFLEEDADAEVARAVLEWSGPVCYRDPRGRRFFATVEGPSVSRQPHKAPEFSAKMVRVESPFAD